MSFDEYSGTSEYTSAARCHHVKKQDLEDVLRNLIDAAAEIHAYSLDDDMPNMLDNLIGEYADKVREAVCE